MTYKIFGKASSGSGSIITNANSSNDSFERLNKQKAEYDAMYYVWGRYDILTCVFAIAGLALVCIQYEIDSFPRSKK